MATLYPTTLHSIQFDIPSVENFSSKFIHHSSWATNLMYCLIHWLSWQNAIWLHGTKKVLIPSWLWNVVWLCSQTQMGFYFQFQLFGGSMEDVYKSEDEQPQDPNQLWTWMIYCYKGTSSYVTYAEIISKHSLNTKDPLAFPSFHWQYACLH